MRPTCERSRGRASAARLLLFTAGLAGCASSASGPAERGVSAEPVQAYYTAEQADRGQRTFTTICAVCHGRTEFTGPIFQLTWMADPVGSLFEHVSTKMPQNRPGSLTAQEYADVVAYLLRINGRPAGERELPPDQELLARMRW